MPKFCESCLNALAARSWGWHGRGLSDWRSTTARRSNGSVQVRLNATDIHRVINLYGTTPQRNVSTAAHVPRISRPDLVSVEVDGERELAGSGRREVAYIVAAQSRTGLAAWMRVMGSTQMRPRSAICWTRVRPRLGKSAVLLGA